MSNPKYPDIKVSTHHKSTDPLAVLIAVSHAMKEAGVSTTECVKYLDNVRGIIQNSENRAQRAVAVVRESQKWVALTD